MNGSAPHSLATGAGWVLVFLARLLSAAFFLRRWAINAPALGARDEGLALFLSFAHVLCLYACGVLCAVSVFASAFAALGRRPWRLFAWAALPAALPFVFAIVG